MEASGVVWQSGIKWLCYILPLQVKIQLMIDPQKASTNYSQLTAAMTHDDVLQQKRSLYMRQIARKASSSC